MNIIQETAIMSQPKNIKKIKDGKVRFTSILQDTGIKNRNNRIYDKKTLQESIDKIMDRVKGRTFLGELDHPIDSNPARQFLVSYHEVSHIITDLSWDGNKLIGEMETLRTDNGMTLKHLLEDRIGVGFSYRGMGDLQQIRTEGGAPVFQVTGPLSTITWDSVSYPSHKSAVARITPMTEGVQLALMESYDPLTIKSETNGYICTEAGVCYVPNVFDKMIEERVKSLKNRFSR